MRTVQDGSGYKWPEQRQLDDDGRDTRFTGSLGTDPNRRSDEIGFARPERWVPQRKEEVVSAVRRGLLSLDEACTRYALSLEEFLEWQQRIDRHGLAGLRV